MAGYAIPIDTAVAVAEQITSGVDNATIHQGVPAFLGIQTAQAAGSGFGQQGTVRCRRERRDRRPGQRRGQRIGCRRMRDHCRVDHHRGGRHGVASSADLTTALADHDPGDRVPVTWTDASGSTHTATVTLGSGPAD